MAKVNVLGAGSWGTALSLLLHKNGHQVKLWSALENEVKMLNEKREHESKLPGVRIPEEVEITTDLEGCLRDVDVAVLAVPSLLPEVLQNRWLRLSKKARLLLM